MDSNMVITRVEVTELIEPKSSNIVSIGYDDRADTAFVTFKNGSLYKYSDVSEEEYQNLRDAESVGKYLQSTFIKKGFEYEKLEDTELFVNETND